MTAHELKLAGMRWLAYEKRCQAVVCERNVRRCLGDPDILGVTKDRYMTEIEIKVSMSDFRRNPCKRHIMSREHNLQFWPKYFYYMVPQKMVEAVLAALPPYAGLLTADSFCRPVLVVKAEANTKSKKLSLLECAKLLRCQTNHVIAAELSALQWKAMARDKHHRFEPDYSI
jgi:hypothetical protein